MGLLAAAGALGGMGQGLQHGLQSMQSAFIQHGLQQEDRDFQMKKLQQQQDWEGQREQRGYAHAEQLQKQNQDFQTGLHEGDRAAMSADKEIEQTRNIIEKDKDRKLEDRKLDIAEAAQKSLDDYHKAVGEYYKTTKGRGGDPKGYKDLSDSTKAMVDNYGKQAEHLFKQAEGALDDKQKQSFIAQGLKALQQGRALLGETPEAPKGAPDLSGDDPFAAKSPLSGKAGAPGAPTSPGLLGKVPDAQPSEPTKSYDQSIEEQLKDPRFNQLKRYLQKPSGAPVAPGPGVTLPNQQ